MPKYIVQRQKYGQQGMLTSMKSLGLHYFPVSIHKGETVFLDILEHKVLNVTHSPDSTPVITVE